MTGGLGLLPLMGGDEEGTGLALRQPPDQPRLGHSAGCQAASPKAVKAILDQRVLRRWCRVPDWDWESRSLKEGWNSGKSHVPGCDEGDKMKH